MLKATCDFQSTTLGNVSKGDPIPDDHHGRELLSVGLAERVTETKVLDRKPKAGPAKKEGEYSTKVVPNKDRKTKKGSSRGRKRNSNDSAKR